MARLCIKLVAVLLLSACSGGPGDVVPSQTEGPSGQDQQSEMSDAREPGETSAGAQSEPTALPPVTREDLLREWWRDAGLTGDPLPVELVREVSDEEYATVQRECMTEAGWPPEDEGLSWSAPADQAESLGLAMYTCWAQFPTPLAFVQPYDMEQLDVIYDWVMDEAIPCYAEQGHLVKDVPSRESFAGEYFATRGFWTPTDGLDLGMNEIMELDEVCPRMPPRDVLFGAD